jgi:hypothetical protein
LNNKVLAHSTNCLNSSLQAIKIATQARLDKNLGVHTDVDPDAVFDHIKRPAFAPILIIVPTSVIQVSSSTNPLCSFTSINSLMTCD